MSKPKGSEDAKLRSRRQILIAGAMLSAAPVVAAAPLGRVNPAAENSSPDNNSEAFIDSLADLMAYSKRTPVLRWPDQYGMEYEEVFFPALDGVTIEGWFIPANSDRLLIMNHPMPCNRYGYPRTHGSAEGFWWLRGQLLARAQGPA